MGRAAAAFLFGFVIVLSGAAQSGTESAALGADLKGASVRHTSLPFGTRLKVVNPQTGREVEVIVTGRLPEDAPRPLEISESAAEELGVSPDADAAELRYQVQTVEVPDAPAAPPVSAPSTPPVIPAAPPAPPASAPAAPPAAPPAPPASPVSTLPVIPPASSAPPAPSASVPPVSPEAPVPLAVLPPARIIPRAPCAEDARAYRVQAGSYRSAANALAAYDRLNGAGFRAAYERFGGNYRVVIAGVPAVCIPETARRLGAAGFPEIWIRPEN